MKFALLTRFLVLCSFVFASSASFAQADDVVEKSLDEKINSAVAPATEWIEGLVFKAIPVNEDVSIPLVLIWLAVAAIFFTIYFKFINLRSFKLAARTIKGKYSGANDPGEITHFQALTAALSATVGLGNIAGVATAISLGGPGATFWMIVMGFFGMTSKFVECTLGVRYREIDKNGKVYGGPMQYLKKGLAERGLKEVGIILAVFFAFMCIGGSFGGGNMYQIHSATTQFVNTFGGGEEGFWGENRWLFGLIIAVIVGVVIIGGIKSIARVTEKLVPLMCGMYVLAALVVLISHAGDLGGAIGQIFSGAFTGDAVKGGFVGVLIQGMRRATFSNEAGVGSAAIAHSAVKTTKPASEGIVALLEPFVDTVVVCTMTALAIVVTSSHVGADPGEGIQITSNAFATVIPWFPMVLAVAVILFAFSTMISWSYYGQQAWAYLFGRSKGIDISYKLIFCACVVVGAAMNLDKVTGFSDAMIFAMCIPNVIGLYILLPFVKKELIDFREHVDKIDSGK
jgi:AGCS family alanine or glycine:cation symporter